MPHESVIGQIVRSVAGRDAKRIFAVVGVSDDGSLLVADGSLRKISSPKKKNLRHVVFTGERVELQGMDEQKLAKFLKSYESPR